MSQCPSNVYPLKGREFANINSGLAAQYCAHLLKSLGGSVVKPNYISIKDVAIEAVNDWAQSGLMYLTGLENGLPLQGPGCIPSCAKGALDALRLLAHQPLLSGINGSTLLCERAALLGLVRRGTVSPNGSCRLLKTKDHWIALNLARNDDWDLLPAWLEEPHLAVNQPTEDLWEQITSKIKHLDSQTLVARGLLMGLPIANANVHAKPAPWYKLGHRGSTHIKKKQKNAQPLVIDLSSLWAGPLCSYLLQQAGARIIKVESINRPDGARRGSKQFYNLINSGKQSVALDFSSHRGRHQLKSILNKADIVIEGSRPRALQQLGIDAELMVESIPGLVWVSISGYGRRPPESNWVAFGDDAAVAAGIAAATNNPPLFCGDALADPLTGLHAAVAALAFWSSGYGGLLDLSLCNTSAHCLNFAPTLPHGKLSGSPNDWQLTIENHMSPVLPPSSRKSLGAAPALGAHTEQILREFQIVC